MKKPSGEDHLRRVRRICEALPETTEKLSHGAPTFFIRKKVYAVFSDNHHQDGHVAVLIPLPPGVQAMMIHEAPEVCFHPAYVGVRGWVGIELGQIDDEGLAEHIRGAWRLIAPKGLSSFRVQP